MWITNGIPKLNDAAFVDNMEDVLTIYEMPYYPEIPVICMDEKPVQLLGKIQPYQPGYPASAARLLRKDRFGIQPVRNGKHLHVYRTTWQMAARAGKNPPESGRFCADDVKYR